MGSFEVIKRVFVLGIVTFMNNYEKLNEKIPLVFGFWFNFGMLVLITTNQNERL